ncbi:T9SS type A sorting domain-containing protein [Altibacter sp. HG106]|uniref:T9SS type A sorting domain-containing protein n=1 Tax=Altibacter sp. HG106 TaxID=3023937 RepID=UPI00235059D1|nr:T9SS type A sorting domain-containing protein [Altibacter sp. HG106]MDC7996379.1 T9SS type A sorting domain-containing protein [Altibacter sp. HG106]
MNRYIVILFLIFTIPIYGQYTAILDSNFEQFLIDEGIDTEQILDGRILTSDAENVTELTIDDINNNISDFGGLEDFSNLAFFDAAFTLCTSINFNGNPQLSELTLAFNSNLESIQIEECITLLQLSLINNKLSTLDVSNNTLISGLSCSNNEIVSLDLTNNADLTFFSCSNNLLDHLDLRNGNNTNITNYNSSNNSDLLCIYVDDADYSQSNWINIDPNSTFVETEAECDALSVQDVPKNNVLLYPNPAIDKFKIEVSGEVKEVQIFNVLGQLERVYLSPSKFYNVSDLSQGRYFVVVKTLEGFETLSLLVK